MIRDLNVKLPTDSNFRMSLETSDEIEQILQQIRMLFGTKPGDVLGSIPFGLDIERYLFTMDFNSEELNLLLTSAIAAYVYYNHDKYLVECKVHYGQDHENCTDYALIDIEINQKKFMGFVVNQ